MARKEQSSVTEKGSSAWEITVWLVAAVVLINLFVAAQALVSLLESRSQYQERAAIQAQNLSQALTYTLAGIIDTADVGLLAVADEAERLSATGPIDARAINAFIAREHRRLPELDSMRIANARGDIAFGTGLAPGDLQSVTDREYFQQLRANPQAGLVISQPVLGRISGKWVIIVARRLNRRDGSFDGVVYAPLALERIQKVLASIDLGRGGRITLRDREMSVIVRHPAPKGVANYLGSRPSSPELRQHLTAGKTSGTFLSSENSDKAPRIISYRGISNYPLYITVALAASDYLAPWWRELYRMSALVVFFVAATVLLSRLLFVRLRHEKEVEEALRKSNEELELRVARRTDELSRSNAQLTVQLAEREHAEKRLQQGRNMLAQIIDTIPQAVFWKDSDSVFLGCNMVFAGIVGVSAPVEIIGQDDYRFYPREEADAYRQDDREVMEHNRPKYHIIEPVQEASGNRLWADTTKIPLRDESGEVYGLLGVFENITERKAIEEARDKALALIESLLTSSPAGVSVFDGKSGDSVMANQALAAMLGGTLEELRAQNFRRLGSWREAGIDRIAEEVLADGVAREMEISLHSTFGKMVHMHGFLSRFEVDASPHLMLIVLDVSEKKRLEEANRLIEAQMLHVQKLESLGVLAGGIAHDFNNILMVVLGNVDLALMRLEPDTPAHDNLLQIESAACRAADLARQMLAYSGKGRFVIENLDLGAVVKEMAQMLEVSISKKVALNYRFAQGLPAISGDATQLRQVVLNLVINASEAIGDQSGVINIGTSSLICDREDLSASWIDDHLPEGAYVMLEVSDTGCGIAREIIPKIFDPFFTTKFTGRGLGMAAVLGIVRGHRGAIKVYSEKGKGTTFRLLLPALAAEAAPEPATSVEGLWQGSGSVLLVDDEASIRSLGQEMLETLGFSVLTASDGREGIELFARHQGEIVCVLLDLTMPELDGAQTFRELRRMRPDLKVIIASGYNELEVSQKFAGNEVAAFLQKPYKLKEMSRKLREALA